MVSAAVAPASGKSLRYKLGKDSRHAVFEGELVGILLALHLIGNQREGKTAMIALDNQAAITALRNNKPQPSHHLLDLIHKAILDLKCKCQQLHIHLKWVPGHEDIAGNELADKNVKLAAEGSV